MIKGNRGQLSIFMGITLILVMSMLAFIVNIGLFVKAKINLQNAVDAAAFSGAATQSRQLTNIAYANWELHNTYKEWMFKYYVLGQIGIFPYNLSPANLNGTNPVSFLLPTPPVSGFTDFDKYNMPSICIHNNSKTNICPMYAIPGIPKFPSVNISGITDINDAFVTQLTQEKAKDCSRRSQANFLTALIWAYGSGKNDVPDVPAVAANRPGAWLEALELAFRIRNLEMIVNRPPVADINRGNLQNFQGQGEKIGYNERPIKAFWSAYRNLGGGAYKDNITNGAAGGAIDELASSFKLTEIPPKVYNAGPNTVSGFLIPPEWSYPGSSEKAINKHYLDLQLMPVNLATMFTTFVDTANQNIGMDKVTMEASCGVSKTALPVPGYIMGFTKNPEVLTYYAVKGESRFIGLFFPTGANSSGFKLTAYAAAKPFGGRIGPKLFNFADGNQSVKMRTDTNKKSAPFISGLQLETGASGGYVVGMPIPSDPKFWVGQGNTVIGGTPEASPPTFGLPNMLYDFRTEDDLKVQSGTSGEFQLISGLITQSKPTLGLYNPFQMRALKDSIGFNPISGSIMNGQEVLNALVRSRRPTRYDAINYLIPHFLEVADKNNAYPFIERLDPIGTVGYYYKLFAPLYGDGLLYTNPNDTGTVVGSYITANDKAVQVYLEALLKVANTIFDLKKNSAAAGLADVTADHTDAAKSIHGNAGTNNARPNDLPDLPASDPACTSRKDLATKFHHFFRGLANGCEIKPLRALIPEYILARSAEENGINRQLFYVTSYYNEPSNSNLEVKPEQLMTAYFPGVRQGITPGDKAIAEHPLKISAPGNESYSARRNFYSTKFFHMAKVIDGFPGSSKATRGRIDYQDTPAFRESEKDVASDIMGTVELKNPLKYDDVTGINNNYFLDF